MSIDRKPLSSDTSAVGILHLSFFTYAVKTRLKDFNNSAALRRVASICRTNDEMRLAVVYG